MAYEQLAAYRVKSRLTQRQRPVIKYLLDHPQATLDEAVAACGQGFTFVRKWMVDKEFMGYWNDIRRWRRAAARERLERAIAQAADRLAADLENCSPRRKGRLEELGEELARTADRLMALVESEQAEPVAGFGWEESTGFPGVDGPGGPRVPGSAGPPADAKPEPKEADTPAPKKETPEPMTRFELDLMIYESFIERVLDWDRSDWDVVRKYWPQALALRPGERPTGELAAVCESIRMQRPDYNCLTEMTGGRSWIGVPQVPKYPGAFTHIRVTELPGYVAPKDPDGEWPDPTHWPSYLARTSENC